MKVQLAVVCVIFASLCAGKPLTKQKRSKHHKVSTSRSRPLDGIRSLLQNTPAVKELDNIESFRQNSNAFLNAELEKRTSPVQNHNIRRGQITRRTPHSNVDPQDTTAFDNFDETSPILWSQSEKHPGITQSFIGTKKGDGEGPDATLPQGGPDAMEPHVTAEDSLDDMPNTAGPNPNIFGGFPENDVWGNFELPAPETIDHLKLALKMSHHRPNYAGDQASDGNDQLYNYEHHALPEYDVMETPPFHEVLWQNAQLHEALKAGAKPACAPGMGSCPPVNAKVTCQNLHHACAVNAQHPTHKVKFAPPCAAKILSLFGCGKPKPEPPPPPPPPKKPPPPPKDEPLPIPLEVPPPPPPPKEDKEKPKKKKDDDSKKKGNDITAKHDPLVDFLSDDLWSEKNIESLSASLNTGIPDTNTHDTGKKKERQSRVNLLNPEQSLALMSAIGTDLEESLTEKFKASERKEAWDESNENDKTGENSKEEHKTEATSDENKNKSSEKTKNSEKLLLKVEKNDNETAFEDSRFSEWSMWTLCDKTCGEGSKSRRRTCMADECEGVTDETSTCRLSKCTVNSPENSETSSTGSEKTESIETATEKTTDNSTDVLSDPYASVKVISNKQSGVGDKSKNDDDSGMLRNAFENLVINRFSKEVMNQSDAASDSNDVMQLAHTVEKIPDSITSTIKAFAKNNTDVSSKDNEEKTESSYQVSVSPLTQPVVQKRQWSGWTTCNSACGIGQTSRRWICDDKPCEGDEASTQAKPCRRIPCKDTKTEDVFQKKCLPLHNELRRRHGAEPLQWSEDLYKKAVEITDHMALRNVPAKNLSMYERPGLNLAYISQIASDVNDEASPCMQAIESWYGQKQNYNYQNPKLSLEDRDFAQLVWKSTKSVGISKSKTIDGDTYIAAVYQPADTNESVYGLKKNTLPRFMRRYYSQTVKFLDQILTKNKI